MSRLAAMRQGVQRYERWLLSGLDQLRWYARRTFSPREHGLLTRQRLTGSSAALVGTTLAMNVLRIGSTLVLTRLLAPADYGIVGIIMSAFFVIGMVTDTGCQAFVVRHERGLDRAFLDTVWTIHLLRGAANAVIAAGLALPLAAMLGKPQLAPLMAVTAVSLAIDGTASLSLLTVLRRGDVRRLSLVDFAAFIIQLAVALIAAWFLRSAWAIVIAIIVQSLARSAGSYLVFSDSSQRLRFEAGIGVELWKFSRIIAASSTITLVISQLDRLVLARLLPLSQLGVYSIAGSLAAAPTAVAFLYVSRIMYPALAAAWRSSPDDIGRFFYALRGPVCFGYLFAAGGLIGSSALLVHMLYDVRYAAASFYLRWLGIGTAMVMVTRPMNELLVAIGHVRATLEMNLVRVCWLLLAIFFGLLVWGANGIVMAVATVELPAYAYAVYKLRQQRLYNVWSDVTAFFAIAAGIIVGATGSLLLSRIATLGYHL